MCSLLGGCESGGGTLAPGRPAPQFEASDLKGGTASLSDFRGKFVVLNFLASWCVPCAQEMPDLRKLQEQMGEELVVVSVGVDDDDDALRKFRDRHKVNFPFLHDSHGYTKSRYRLAGFPETFILDPDGKLIMFPDPHNGVPGLKVSGPRRWASGPVRAMFRELIARRDGSA